MGSPLKQIFKALKEKGPLSASELAAITGLNVTGSLQQAEREGWLRYDARQGLWHIPHILMPPQEHPGPRANFVYEAILPMAEPFVREARYMNPLVEYLPEFDQGGRGSCVGHALAYLMQLNYLQVIGTPAYPTIEDRAASHYNTQEEVPGCPRALLYDSWYYSVKSPQWCYYVARMLGNIPASMEGAYVEDGIRAMKEIGCVEWDQCVTPKTPNCAPPIWPRGSSTTEEIFSLLCTSAGDHRLEGYAEARTFDGVCDLIQKHGSAVMAIDIFENYTRGGCTGLFPNPIGAVVGAHALVWVGFDREKRELYCLHSWRGNWSHIGGISETYFKKGAWGASGPIDTEEVLIARMIYAKVTIIPSVRADIEVGGTTYQDITTGLTVMLERYKPATIRAIAKDPAAVEPDIEALTVMPQAGEETYTITFTEVHPKPVKTWWETLFDYFKERFGWQ